MAWMARFRARSPPRPCRYRTVIPLLAGIGLVPPSGVRGLAAAPAGVGEAHDGLGGADRPDAEAAGQAGSDVIDDGQQLDPVVLELAPGLAEGERQAADLGLADGLLAAGLSGQVPAGERGQGPARQGPAGRPAVGVIAG
jgi:hypothetical protein